MNKIRIPKKYIHGRIKRRGISAGGGGFGVPLDGLVLWLKADAITGLNDNDPVATWNDSSGNSNHATQGTGILQPLYKTNIVNGRPVVRFDGNDDGMLTANTVFSSNPISFFIVYSGVLDNRQRRAIQGIDDVAHSWLIGPYLDTYRSFNGAFITGPAVVAGQFRISAYIHDGTTARFWLDGALIGSNGSNNVPDRIGLGASGGAAERLNGDIAEVLGYTGDKTASRTMIENYLRNKYAI